MAAPKRPADAGDPADMANRMMQTGLAFFDPRKLLDEEQWALSHFRDIEKAWLDEVKKSSESFMALSTKMREAQNPAEALQIYMRWLQETASQLPATSQRFMQLWQQAMGAAMPMGRAPGEKGPVGMS